MRLPHSARNDITLLDANVHHRVAGGQLFKEGDTTKKAPLFISKRVNGIGYGNFY